MQIKCSKDESLNKRSRMRKNQYNQALKAATLPKVWD